MFRQRKINLEFSIGLGEKGLDGFRVVTVTGLRVQCQIIRAGGASMSQANLKVFGLNPSDMQELSELNKARMALRNNQIKISANDDNGKFFTVFHGQIAVAQQDYQALPSSSLVIVAFEGMLQAVQPANPTTFPDDARAEEIMKVIADKMGYGFHNNGVNITLATQYLQGSLRDQAQRCARAGGFQWTIDNNVLEIWPVNEARKNLPAIPIITPKNGLVGYPSCADSIGINVKCLFLPMLKMQQLVEIRESMSYANGRWLAYNIEHDLDSEIQGGNWFTKFSGNPYI